MLETHSCGGMGYHLTPRTGGKSYRSRARQGSPGVRLAFMYTSDALIARKIHAGA
jgi:hypothetical protein